MKNTLELVSYGPVIPVIVINRLEDAVPMAQALPPTMAPAHRDRSQLAPGDRAGSASFRVG